MQGLYYNGSLSLPYYQNAWQYYNSTIVPSFNNWLDNLNQEVQNGQTLINSTPGDILEGTLAIVNTEGFIQWAKTVPTTSSQ